MTKTKTPRGRQTFKLGPFKGVRTTRDPQDDPPDLLTDAYNLYCPDPQGLAGFYQRPGFNLLFGGAAVVTSATAFKWQGFWSHPQLDGSTISFAAIGGKLFRISQDLTTATDVTPVGVTIDPSATTRVYFASIVESMVVTDGVNRPWIASNLSSTPITGTYIDYDGLGGTWSAFGRPAYYNGALFFILNQVNGVARRTDLSWCNPGTPATGYQQPNFDNNWTLETSSAGPLYAIYGTNVALYYWRELSIGTATGVVGPDLASTATEDAISFNVGTQTCATIQQFGDAFYFCDALGRPWRLTPGQPPQPIWLQMRGIVETSNVAFQTITTIVSTSVLEPTLNHYWVGIWSPTPSTAASVTELYQFDANTGTYTGRITVGGIDNAVSIDCLGTFTDSAGRVVVVVGGSKVADGTTGYLWSFNSSSEVPQFLTTEDGVLLTTEDGVLLTTEGEPAIWADNDVLPDIRAVTGRVGYDDSTNLTCDMATVVTLTPAPIKLSVQTSAASNSLQGIPEPAVSQDGTYRFVAGLDVMGRGPRITIQALESDEQFVLESVSLVAMASACGPEDG